MYYLKKKINPGFGKFANDETAFFDFCRLQERFHKYVLFLFRNRKQTRKGIALFRRRTRLHANLFELNFKWINKNFYQLFKGTETMNGAHTGVVRDRPRNRRMGMKLSIEEWLTEKKKFDGADGLWRIHDEIYDFSDFAEKHPGGKYWLRFTKGTDITEAFESHHISDKAEKLLQKFHVRKAKTPRLSLITFHENGFYKTLKNKIRKSKPVELTGATWQTSLLTDSLLFGFFITSLAALDQNYLWSVVSGFFLNMVSVAAHNFFHMKDNFRMYYFNFSLLSFRDWRISHALSHHQYANTILDLEISLFEPAFEFLPTQNKNIIRRYLPWLISPLVFAFTIHIEFVKRFIKILKKEKTFHLDEFIAFSVPAIMWLLSDQGMRNVLIAWNITILSGSFTFLLVGLTAAHHHPEIYHEGDYLGEDKDFGILQLAAVRDRKEINGNLFLTMITFGDHALHHLFPTIDHGKLSALRPYFEETCEEFNIDFELKSIGNLFTGMYYQLARNYFNTKLFIKKN